VRKRMVKKVLVSFDGARGKLYGTLYGDKNFEVGVVLCPPHPLYGGSRNDFRLVKVAEKLAENGIHALCIDYESYSGGLEEVKDVLDVISYLKNTVKSLGLFGYSFGAVVASNVATQTKVDSVVFMSILEKVDGLEVCLNIECPKLFIHGEFDEIASYKTFKRLYSQAKEPKDCLILETDHFYMREETMEKVLDSLCKFFKKHLLTS